MIISAELNTYAQKGMTFEYAVLHGKPYQHLDSLYRSAVHGNPKLAVFNTPQDQQRLQTAYMQFMQSLGIFLKSNNFKWDKPTRCFNRIYFEPGGKADYFLYNFPTNEISIAKEKQFNLLLNRFLKSHKISITANEPFAQCSPIKYND